MLPPLFSMAETSSAIVTSSKSVILEAGQPKFEDVFSNLIFGRVS